MFRQREGKMAITRDEKLAALVIALQSEIDGVERAKRAGNGSAVAINQLRVTVATQRIAAFDTAHN